MIHSLIAILGILLTIFFVVGTHESAHFLMARSLGIKVLRFSIGFGKTLVRWTDKKGTEYVVALIPLGGYVKMLDESEGTVPASELHLAYNRQPFYKKFLVVLAGPLTNIFCALVLYWVIFMVGFVTVKPMIGSVEPKSIAAEAGVQANTQIIAIDNSTTSSWTGIMLRLIAHAGDQDQVKIETRNPADNKTETHILDLANWRLDKLTPDPLSSLGIAPYEPVIPLIIGVISKNTPAAASLLKIGDKIIAINTMAMNNWSDVIGMITKHPNETLIFYIQRNNQFHNVAVKTGYQNSLFLQKSGFLGLGPDYKIPPAMLQTVQYGPLVALTHAWKEIGDFTYFNLLLFGKMVTGKISVQSLGGPITIFETAGDALNSGLLAFLGFLAFLSIAIGVVNFLPIPGLDGGHMFIQIVEFIIQRQVPDQVLNVMYRVGFLLIFFVLIQAIVNDVMRLY
jgi:regulator of sigma E protease